MTSGFSAVAGVGPRTGTSFVMCSAVIAGIPVYGERFPRYCVPEHNPAGYWELEPHDRGPWHGRVVKLWGRVISEVNPSRLVLLERQDKEQQLKSIEKVREAELEMDPDLFVGVSASQVLDTYVANITAWTRNISPRHILRVATHELSDRIGEVLTFLQGGIKCHSS
jgi:hypothetical protein